MIWGVGAHLVHRGHFQWCCCGELGNGHAQGAKNETWFDNSLFNQEKDKFPASEELLGPKIYLHYWAEKAS